MSGLMDRICQYPALTLIGMCKNAGKTSALGHVLRGLEHLHPPLALTSIGRDGESVDRVTGTHKPGIFVRRGTLIATAAGLLGNCDITREILAATGIHTPLGEVVVVRALSDGQVDLAGPSMVDQLVALRQLFGELGARRVLIDGAISRKTLCSPRVSDATVLSVGASCGRDMARVVAEAAHTCRMLGLPLLEDRRPEAALAVHSGARAVLIGPWGTRIVEAGEPLAETVGGLGDIEILYLSGALSQGVALPLIRRGGLEGVTVAVADASRILLDAETCRRLEARGARLRVLEGVHLAAVTVNPFSAYGHHFDGPEFLAAMTAAVDVPVYDLGPIGGRQA